MQPFFHSSLWLKDKDTKSRNILSPSWGWNDKNDPPPQNEQGLEPLVGHCTNPVVVIIIIIIIITALPSGAPEA